MNSGEKYFHGRLKLVVGNIVKMEADDIVNAANSSLLGGGGVDGAIHSAGGPSILRECRELRKTRFQNGLPTGQAVETTPGELQAKYVIHTVGPVWSSGKANEAELLASCYFNSLQIAEKLSLNRILFPSISTGVYGYRKKRAASIVWKCASWWIEKHEKPNLIVLVFYWASDLSIFLEGKPKEVRIDR